MKAMILAAGLGTRLRPLTDNLPKALIRVGEFTLLEFALLKLKHAGFNEIIINLHHMSGLIREYLAVNNNFGCSIQFSDESDQLLDTGGGLKKAAWFFDDDQPFVVYNCDIISSMNLKELYALHLQSGALATLAVRDRSSRRYLLFDARMNLCGWKNIKTGETIIQGPAHFTYTELAFSGIHVISPEIFRFFPKEDKFSITNMYLSLASGRQIKGYADVSEHWLDAGKPESLARAQEIIKYVNY
ncbi:MAG: nucleotidyltransferase family protein [Lentimicrobiaceae bacterium]|nr:nucleotidyltransferase family protein [Lentimicrobiaceae bacterium]